MSCSKKKSWVRSAFSTIEASNNSSGVETATGNICRNINDIDTAALCGGATNNTATTSTIISEKSLSSANWMDIFAPQKLDELAVHAKKVEELEEWLKCCDTACRNQPAQLCLVTGPSGAGKTTAVKLLAEAHNYDVQEWVNPVDRQAVTQLGDDPQMRSYVISQVEAFKSFLLRASRYKSLLLGSSSKRLLLVEDFPNALIKDGTTFSSILDDFLCYGKSALVFIVADARSRQLNISYNLFPDDIKTKYNIKHIGFNPIASTLMTKAMKRFCYIMRQQKNAHIYTVPEAGVVSSIVAAAQGDIRNALITLHFSSLKGISNMEKSLEANNSKGRRQKKQQFQLKSIGRSESITTMHSLGRIFNPKYTSEGRLTHSPELLVEQLSTEPRRVLDSIYTNYIAHFANIEDLRLAVDGISGADVIMNEYREEMLASLALNIAIRSVMVENKAPVHGWRPIRGSRRYTVAKPDTKTLTSYGLQLNISQNLFSTEYSTYINHIKPLTH